MAEVRGDLTGMQSGIGQSLKNIGRDMTYAVTVPLVAAGAASAKLAMDFEASARNIASISTDYAAHFDEYNQRILEFGTTTQAGSRAAINALYEIYSAGVLNFAQAETIMQASVATAEAGVADLTATTKGLTTAMLAFGAANDEAFGGDFQVAADYFSNVLTRTVQLGVGSMDMFVTSMGRAGAAAATSGASYLDLGAAMAFLTQRGLTTYNAGTALNNLFNKMISPTDRMRQSFQQLGVTTSNELFEKFGDLGGVMEALYSTVGDNTEAWGEMFNTIQGKRAAFAIFEDISAYKNYLVEFNTDLDNATSSARAEQLKSFSAQVKLMGSALETLGIQIGLALLPMLTPLVQGFTDFFTSLQNSNPLVMQLVVIMGALVAAIGPLTWLVGTLLSPMGLFLAAITGIVTVLATDFQGIGTSIANAVNAALPSLSTLIDSVRLFIELITNPDALNTLDFGAPVRAMSGVDWFDNAFADNPGAAFNSFGAGGTPFEVRRGDTISGISQRTGLTQDAIRRAIGAPDDYSIQPGSYRTEGGFQGAQFANAPMQLTEADFADNSLQGRITRAWAQVGGFITNAIEDTLRDVVAWVQGDGAIAIGYVIGSIAAGLVHSAERAFTGVGSALGGAGDAANFAGTFAGHVSEGIQNALRDANINPSSFEGFVSNVVAAIIAAFLLFKFIGVLPLGGFVSRFMGWLAGQLTSHILSPVVNVLLIGPARAILKAIAGAITGAFSWGSFLFQYYVLSNIGTVATTVGYALLGLLTAVFTSPITWGIVAGLVISSLIPEETKNTIGEAVLTALGQLIPGVDAGTSLDAFRADAESKIYNLLAGIFDLAGNTGLAERLRQLALGSGASAERIMTNAFRDGFINGDYSIEELMNLNQPGVFNQWNTGDTAYTFPGQRSMTVGDMYGDTNPLFARLQAISAGLASGLSEAEVRGAMESSGIVAAATEAGQTAGTVIEEAVAAGLLNPMSATGIGGGNGKRAGGSSSVLKPMFDTMNNDVLVGGDELVSQFTTSFASVKGSIDTATTDTATSLTAFVLAIMLAIPATAVALATFNLTVAIGMSSLLTTVTTFADQIIAKWNGMLATLGVAPVMGGSAITGGAGGTGTVAVNNVNMYVTTNDPNTINNAFRKQGIDLKAGKGK